MSHRLAKRARSVPATTRAGPRGSTNTQALATRRREQDGSQLIIIGAALLGVGLVAAIGVAYAGSNQAHPVLRILPWLPVVVGFCLLVYALGRATSARAVKHSRTAPSQAMESQDGLPEGAR